MEDEEEPEEVFQQSPASTSRRKLLLPALSSSVRRGSLSSLLGDELCQVSAPRHNCPSPARGSRGRSPSPQCRRDTRLRERNGSVGRKPAKLLISSLHTYGSPDLSPRYAGMWLIPLLRVCASQAVRGPGGLLRWWQRGEGVTRGNSHPLLFQSRGWD